MEDFKPVVNGLQQSEQLLISDIISSFQAEARCFVMNGIIRDMAFYEGSGNLDEAKNFVEEFLKSNASDLPEVVVVDVGYNEAIGWFILEFNACWGAGLNNCSAENVIDCIVGATVALG